MTWYVRDSRRKAGLFEMSLAFDLERNSAGKYAKIDKTLEKGFFCCKKYLHFFGILEKICRRTFLVIGFKSGNPPGIGENVKNVKLEFWAMGKE